MKQKTRINSKQKNILFISSSGGHYEQLSMLKTLKVDYNSVFITEKTKYMIDADGFLLQVGRKDIMLIPILIINTFMSMILFIKYRPKYIITTGALVSIPIALIGKIFKTKLIYVETLARVNDATKTGSFLYKYADLFIIQWRDLQTIYPKAIYGGSIY